MVSVYMPGRKLNGINILAERLGNWGREHIMKAAISFIYKKITNIKIRGKDACKLLVVGFLKHFCP